MKKSSIIFVFLNFISVLCFAETKYYKYELSYSGIVPCFYEEIKERDLSEYPTYYKVNYEKGIIQEYSHIQVFEDSSIYSEKTVFEYEGKKLKRVFSPKFDFHFQEINNDLYYLYDAVYDSFNGYCDYTNRLISFIVINNKTNKTFLTMKLIGNTYYISDFSGITNHLIMSRKYKWEVRKYIIYDDKL